MSLTGRDSIDGAFSRFVNEDSIAQAWNELLADQLLDGALGLAEGEGKLFRTHSSGLTSSGLIMLGVELAGLLNQKDVLDRAQRIARAMKDEELTRKVGRALSEIDTKGGVHTRAVQLDTAEFVRFKDSLARILRAKLAQREGDLPAIFEDFPAFRNREIYGELKRLSQSESEISESVAETAEILNRLSRGLRSKSNAMARPRSTTPIPLDGRQGSFQVAANDESGLSVASQNPCANLSPNFCEYPPGSECE